ncbi:MAG TPA: IS1595 family transposase, partial [Caulobacteraceae bacterium]|nr:IS1595 family transposase [Caulobacteraceae bacterium]
MKTDFASLYELFEAIPDERAAIDHFNAIRWKHGAFCPYCGSDKVYHFKAPGIHKCGEKACNQRFSIKVGTVFEGTKIPLRKWLAAIWLITSHKKGIASTQLARDIAVTQKTAWFMTHRLRHAARTRAFNRTLKGQVEVDETYVGGKAINRHKGKSDGPGTSGKTAVIGVVQRKGGVHARVIDRTDTATLDAFVHENVSPDAVLVSTDEHSGYRHLSRTFTHGVVRHSAGQYVVGQVHTQTIEGFWSLLKRQIYGIHHWVSAKHLNRYVAEAAWRYNRREV